MTRTELDAALQSPGHEQAVRYNGHGWLCKACVQLDLAPALPVARHGAIAHVQRRHRGKAFELEPVGVPGSRPEVVKG